MKKVKQALQDAFAAPPPQDKNRFLRSVGQPRIGFWEFVLSQASYIGKQVWILSFLVLLAALFGIRFLQRDLLWILTAMMPYMAVTAVTEQIRSETYGMAELEVTTRFSLKNIRLARMTLVGLVHGLLLVLLMLLGRHSGLAAMAQLGVYLLVPYLLTTVSGLWLTRRLRSQEAMYGCLGIAVVVSVLPLVSRTFIVQLYQAMYFPWWLTAAVGLSVLVGLEYQNSMKRMEEQLWNLS